MVKEAEVHAEEDKKNRDVVETKNGIEGLIHSTEKSLKDHGDNNKVAAIKGEVETAIAAAKEAALGGDVEKMKAASMSLAQISMKIGEAMYGGQHSDGPDMASDSDMGNAGGSGSSKGGKGEKVVDADFEEVKDDKKKSA
jgi:molecular chaperone DnaK